MPELIKENTEMDFINDLIQEHKIETEIKNNENRESAQECRRCNESGDCWICILTSP